MSSETPQTNIKEKKDLKKTQNCIEETRGNFSQCVNICIVGMWREEGKNGAEEIFEVNIGWGLSKINDNKSQIQKGQNTPRTIN